MGTASDDFNRSDENPIASPWVYAKNKSGYNCRLKNNAVTYTTGGTEKYNTCYYNSGSFTNNQWAQLYPASTHEFGDYGGFAIAVLRWTGAPTNTGYFGLFNTHPTWKQLYFVKINDGTHTIIGSVATHSVTLTTASALKADATDSTLTWYVEGSSKGTRTDSTYTAGQAGIGVLAYGNTEDETAVDTWTAGDWTDPSASGAAIFNPYDEVII